MALDTTALDADLGAILDDLPETLSFPAGSVDAGDQYTCNRVSLREADLQELREETRESLRVTLSVQKSDFGTVPGEGDWLTYDSATVLVLEYKDSPDGLERRLFCGEEWSR